VQNLTWSDSLVAFVDIDYRVAPDSAWCRSSPGWARIPGLGLGSADVASNEVEIRVYNEDGLPIDYSDGKFGIMRSYYAAVPETLTLAPTAWGSSHAAFQIANSGNLPLTVSGVTCSNPEFWVGRSSFVVPPASSDTLGVYFEPTSDGIQSADIGITSGRSQRPAHAGCGGRGRCRARGRSAIDPVPVRRSRCSRTDRIRSCARR
jgi:hypothetical protein